MIVILWYQWVVDHTNRRKESQKIQLYYQAHKTVLSNKTISIWEEEGEVWFCALKKQISSKPFAFQICHQWNWCWPCKVLLFCATSCEGVIHVCTDSIWCLQIPPLSTLLLAAVDTVFILFVWQTTAVGNEATSNTSMDRARSG